MKRLGALIGFCVLAGCAREGESLEYGDLVPITVRVEDYQGPVSLLFSSSSGHTFALVEVIAPTVLEHEVPLGGSVSARFADFPAYNHAVFSIADLRAGDVAVLRPMIWNEGRRWIHIAPI